MRSPCFQSRARRVILPVSACDSVIGGMAGGHGRPPAAGSGASPVWICRSPGLTAGSSGTGAVPGTAGGAVGRARRPVRAARFAVHPSHRWASYARQVDALAGSAQSTQIGGYLKSV